MAKADVLARVNDDLARGHTYVAAQRLRTLLAVVPDDLEVRRRLAEVYRLTGNQVEAGRWGYLTDEVSPAELTAYARAHPSPWRRLQLLNWSGGQAGLPSDPVRKRLADLIAEAERDGAPEPVRWAEPKEPESSRGFWLACLIVVLVFGSLGTLVVIGIVRISRAIFN